MVAQGFFYGWVGRCAFRSEGDAVLFRILENESWGCLLTHGVGEVVGNSHRQAAYAYVQRSGERGEDLGAFLARKRKVDRKPVEAMEAELREDVWCARDRWLPLRTSVFLLIFADVMSIFGNNPSLSSRQSFCAAEDAELAESFSERGARDASRFTWPLLGRFRNFSEKYGEKQQHTKSWKTINDGEPSQVDPDGDRSMGYALGEMA